MPKSKKRNKPRSRPKARPPLPQPPVRPPLSDTLRAYIESVDVAEIKQKSRLLSVLFCDFANRTDDNKMNLMGIFDRAYVHPEKKISPRFTLYARTAETFEDNLWVRIFDPDNEPIAEIRFEPPEIPLEEGRGADWPNQLQFFIPIRIPMTKEGVYYFDIAYRNFSLGGAGMVAKFRKIGESEHGTDTYE